VQQFLDPQYQLPGAERFDDIVIGADFQAEDAVDFPCPGCKNENGDIFCARVAPKVFAYLQSVHLRQHQVQDNQIRFEPPGFL
jgi:hypothetical protein